MLEFSDGPVVGDILPPKGVKLGELVAASLGPAAIADTSEGLGAYRWQAEYDGTNLVATRDGTADPQVIPINQGGISFIDFTFDQAGQPTVVYARANAIFIYWLDPFTNQYEELLLSNEQTECFCDLDIKTAGVRDGQVVVSYRRGQAVYVRLQLERYTIEQQVLTNAALNTPLLVGRLTAVGLSDLNRIQWCGTDPL